MTVACVPVAGLQRWNTGTWLQSASARARRPVLLYVFADEFFAKTRARLPAGIYRLDADLERSKAILLTLGGRKVGEGDLCVCQTSTPTVLAKGAKPTVTGGIDSVEAGLLPPHVKVCGHVTIKQGKQSITISGCVEAGF
jgi:hypothetical protein